MVVFFHFQHGLKGQSVGLSLDGRNQVNPGPPPLFRRHRGQAQGQQTFRIIGTGLHQILNLGHSIDALARHRQRRRNPMGGWRGSSP